MIVDIDHAAHIRYVPRRSSKARSVMMRMTTPVDLREAAPADLPMVATIVAEDGGRALDYHGFDGKLWIRAGMYSYRHGEIDRRANVPGTVREQLHGLFEEGQAWDRRVDVALQGSPLLVGGQHYPWSPLTQNFAKPDVLDRGQIKELLSFDEQGERAAFQAWCHDNLLVCDGATYVTAKDPYFVFQRWYEGAVIIPDPFGLRTDTAVRIARADRLQEMAGWMAHAGVRAALPGAAEDPTGRLGRLGTWRDHGGAARFMRSDEDTVTLRAMVRMLVERCAEWLPETSDDACEAFADLKRVRMSGGPFDAAEKIEAGESAQRFWRSVKRDLQSLSGLGWIEQAVEACLARYNDVVAPVARAEADAENAPCM